MLTQAPKSRQQMVDDGQLTVSPKSMKDRIGGIRKHLAFAGHHLDWYWSLVPLLAVAAYASVLRIGFLGDDLVLFGQAHTNGIDARVLLPHPNSQFYRPLGVFFIWQVGAQIWGNNPLPFHLVGLLVRAAASLTLGLWLAEVTGRRGLGLLAGGLFAVFPLHSEAVGWIAAQWDAWATLFGLLSLYCFTRWWWHTDQQPYLYLLALLCYTLGLFTKESLLT